MGREGDRALGDHARTPEPIGAGSSLQGPRTTAWRLAGVALALLVTLGNARGAFGDEERMRAPERHVYYNDQYIFASTRALNDMEAAPALKVTLLPVALVVDVVLLPFAVIGGFFG